MSIKQTSHPAKSPADPPHKIIFKLLVKITAKAGAQGSAKSFNKSRVNKNYSEREETERSKTKAFTMLKGWKPGIIVA